MDLPDDVLSHIMDSGVTTTHGIIYYGGLTRSATFESGTNIHRAYFDGIPEYVGQPSPRADYAPTIEVSENHILSVNATPAVLQAIQAELVYIAFQGTGPIHGPSQIDYNRVEYTWPAGPNALTFDKIMRELQKDDLRVTYDASENTGRHWTFQQTVPLQRTVKLHIEEVPRVTKVFQVVSPGFFDEGIPDRHNPRQDVSRGRFHQVPQHNLSVRHM